MSGSSLMHPDSVDKGETTMNGLLGKLLGPVLQALAPKLLEQLRPVFENALKGLLDQFLKNLGGSQAGGVMSLSSGVTQEQVEAAANKAVTEFLDS